MADPQQGVGAGLEQDPLVEALVPDPTHAPPPVTMLQGYLGRGTTEGDWRLYLTPELDEYVELPEAEEIVYHQKVSDGQTQVWIHRERFLTVRRHQATEVVGEFLAGSIARTQLRRAAVGGRPFATPRARTRVYSCRCGYVAPPAGDRLSEVVPCDPGDLDRFL